MKKTNCDCKRLIGPSGIWSVNDLIGAVVQVGSLPVSNFGSAALDVNSKFVIESIDFRISLDGKAITVVKLNGLDGYIFTLKDLIFVGIYQTNEKEE